MIKKRTLLFGLFALSLFFFLVTIKNVSAVSLSSANPEQFLGYGKQNNPYLIAFSCGNCSFMNVTLLTSPPKQNTIMLGEYSMIKNGTIFYYNFTNTSNFGDYHGSVHGDLYGVDTPNNFYFTINGSGSEFTTSSAILDFILFSVFAGLLIGNIFFIARFPKGNNKGMMGEVTSVNNMKYVRIFLMFVEYLFVFGLLFISSNLASAYLGDQLFSSFLFTLWRISFGILPIMFLLMIVYMLVNAFEDKKIKGLLERGFQTGGPEF